MKSKRTRLLGAGAVTAVVVAASSVAGGGTALASGSCGTLAANHCYALATMGTYAGDDPIYMNQVGADLKVACLAPGDDNTEFANWEMWMSTNDTNPNSGTDSGNWVEEGMKAGTIADTTNNTNYTGFQWFWADSRPSGGYHEHFIAWATANEWTNVTIRFVSGTDWDVERAGSVVGESTGNAAYAGGTEIGAEMAVDTNGQVWGDSRNYQYTNGGSWSPVDAAFAGPVPSSNDPGYSYSYSYDPTDFDVTTPAHACGTTPEVVRATRLPADSAARLSAVRGIADRAAAGYATGATTSVTTVRTTRGAATGLDGSKVTGAAAATPVYLVQELGSFATRQGSPSDAKYLIRGRAMDIVISATTGQILDWGIQAPSYLRSLGPVQSLGR